ncbi:fungal-specific transcription factor domain-containing protein [Thelonectria olida]|uniref:Fungal-specific transcription factor domain-containing protein n=1 Tax=Thelonectria olida TaxID=1576542 RepID=A0A9P8VY97_9HYPO|nr:fungal-specific transcription factor domain-containing protein [Thelonectria olida]
MADPKPCWECLKKRLACDFTRPACRKCRLRNTECPGYGKKPLKWLEPGQTRSKGRRAKNESNIIRLCLKDTSETSTVVEAIKYYNNHICPDLEVVGPAGISESPFFVQFASASDLPASIRQTMVSIALAHRILQFEPGFESDRATLSTRLQIHRGGAIKELAREVKACSEANIATLAAVLTFLFAEIQQCLSPNWRLHCNAAHAIMDTMGGMPMLILSQPFLRHLLRYFVLIEVLGSTTSPNVEPDKARRQLEIISLLPHLYGDGLSTVLPWLGGPPPELVQHLILINYWRSRTAESISCQNPQRYSPLELLDRVVSFSVEDWVSGIHRKQHTGDVKMDSERLPLGLGGWEKLPYIFQSSVVLYCISSLFDSDSTPCTLPDTANERVGHIGIGALRRTHRDALLRDLKDLASPSQAQLRKAVLWPLVMAGIEVDATDTASKVFILSELSWMSKTLGTASPLIAKEYLEKLWASSGAKCWNDLFDRCYVFAM